MVYFKSIALALVLSKATADNEQFSTYTAMSSVADHAGIEFDQQAMETYLGKGTDDSFGIAKEIYTNGGNSKSYALITVIPALTADIAEDTVVQGKNSAGQAVEGTVMEFAGSGQSQIKIQYKTTDELGNHVDCRVGGLPEADAMFDGCLAESGEILAGGVTLTYEYTPSTDNLNARTLQRFSTQAEAKMGKCPSCPYVDYDKFYKYYGRYDYADHWVDSAFRKSVTSFDNGNANFGSYSFEGLTEVIKKGTAYMHVWMYVIREFEDALDDCKIGCINCNDDPVHAWDEGVAFYHGAEGENLLHKLADKRCVNYNTCGRNGGETEGTSKVNFELYKLFASGQQNLLDGKCDEARLDKEAIVPLMTVPLVQGTLRYAYITDKQAAGSGEKEDAEGAIFAATVLPMVNACSTNDAKIIYDNMAVNSGKPNFADVKAAFERNYDCMGIDAADVGGLWDAANGAYFEGAAGSGAVSMMAGTILFTLALSFVALF